MSGKLQTSKLMPLPGKWVEKRIKNRVNEQRTARKTLEKGSHSFCWQNCGLGHGRMPAGSWDPGGGDALAPWRESTMSSTKNSPRGEERWLTQKNKRLETEGRTKFTFLIGERWSESDRTALGPLLFDVQWIRKVKTSIFKSWVTHNEETVLLVL